ncbi:AbiJ-NTD4 domain-containing protein [Xanthomonas bundabergensis]|uniref:AbiJ-NTD4 domain-containing protein n=1 Tax=Xanthomonas bundabergensis TaxID=3160842 RepID=UPI0035199F8B
MSFSERMGLKPVKSLIQTQDIDPPLRNALWDALHIVVWSTFENRLDYGHVKKSNLQLLVYQLWHRFFHVPVDHSPKYFEDAVEFIREWYFKASWNECYDLIEFVILYAPDGIEASLQRFANRVLEEHLSGYRIIEGCITPITAPEELESIEQALGSRQLNAGAVRHFKAALQMLSDRAAPDHRNSIKESISALESLCKELTGDSSATLGQTLKPLEDKGVIHPALRSALAKLYGYTSDSGGIRHAMLEEPSLTFADSKFMLVACTAFANYLIEKSRT